MEFAVRPQPVRPPETSRPGPAPESESGRGFATAVDATLAGTDATSAKQGEPPANGNGPPNLSSPLFGPDILVAGPNEGTTLPAGTPQAPGLKPFPSELNAEAKPMVADDAAGRDVQGQPEVPVPLKNGPKSASKDSQGAPDTLPQPPATCVVVLARAFDRAVPGRSAQAVARAADAIQKEKDDEPSEEPTATIASPQDLPLPALKVPALAPDTGGSDARDPETRQDAIAASANHAARETETRIVPGTLASRDGDGAGFALPPSATDKGDARPPATGVSIGEPLRVQGHAPEPKPQSAAQPVVAAQPGRIGHDLGVEIARRMSIGGDQLVVRLSPAEFGRIEVRMSFDDRGGLSTVFAADRPAALDMLRRDSADLSRALNDAGFRSDANTLRFDGGDRGSGQHRTPWQNAAPKGGHAADPAETEMFDPGAFRTLQTRGRYDLMA